MKSTKLWAYSSFAITLSALASGFVLARPARTQVYIPVPVPVRSYYAAYAYSSSTNLAGIAWAAASVTEARTLALDACKEGGIKNCEVVIVFRDGCSALATSAPDGVYGVSSFEGGAARYGRPYKLRWESALEACRRNGGVDCKLKAAVCADGRPTPDPLSD